MARVRDLDIVFLVYDEPRRDEFWQDLQAKCPRARRIQGVKGLDGGFKAAVAAGGTDHVITVDGDCIVDPTFFELAIDDDLLRATTRIDWPSRNVVNGIVSGNGGIKCWPKSMALSMRSHEHAGAGERSIDFPRADSLEGDGPHRVEHTIPMATVHCNGSPLQAFRSAFREAVRLWVVGRPAGRDEPPADGLHRLQRHRLMLWCSVGADVENGAWCLYGARLAIRMLHLEGWDYLAINDFDWFDDFWREEVGPRFAGDELVCPRSGYAWDQSRLVEEIAALGRTLHEPLGLEIAELTADQSRFFKQIYEPPVNLNTLDRLGTMFQRGIGVAQEEERARRCYEAAARVGHPSALYNLARLELAVAADRSARDRGIACLREANALGNAYAAHRLGCLHRIGRHVERDPARALALFTLAVERGFAGAHRDLAELYEAGDGVAPDAERARRHRQLAEAAGRAPDGPRDEPELLSHQAG
jgi:hypothetical protein